MSNTAKEVEAAKAKAAADKKAADDKAVEAKTAAETKATETKSAASTAAVELGDGSMDKTPTTTQLTEPAPQALNDPSDSEPQIVRHDVPGGAKPAAMEKTTIKEEVRILDAAQLPKDRDERIRTMAVLAHSQGINQSVVSGKEVLTVFQDGSHTVESVPKIPESAKEAKNVSK